jgi:hypothetical protein
MFSGSNSYLGGQSGRQNPGQQFGSSFNQPQQQQQQQAPNAFVPQPTGFAGNPTPFQSQPGQFPMQGQPTGFQQQQQQIPQPQLQQQYTGYPGQQQGQFQTGAPPMPPMPPMPQQQQSPAPMQPQQTGFSQMAASFQSAPTSTAKPKGRRAPKTTKIPSIRLSFITAKDQAQFETLFKSAVGEDSTLSGDKSRDILMRSGLDGNSLSQIW